MNALCQHKQVVFPLSYSVDTGGIGDYFYSTSVCLRVHDRVFIRRSRPLVVVSINMRSLLASNNDSKQ